MESSAATRCLSSRRMTANSSFRLRCPSLNSLRLRRIFDVFDKNHDSLITVHELSQALKLLGLDTDLSDLHSMVQPYIKPGNTGLRFEDFEALHRSINHVFFGLHHNHNNNNLEEEQVVEPEQDSQEESDLSEAFKVFDEDGDGYISARELQAVLRKLGLPEGREIGRVEKMISCVDRDHDGRVDFFEFKDMMRTHVIVPSA